MLIWDLCRFVTTAFALHLQHPSLRGTVFVSMATAVRWSPALGETCKQRQKAGCFSIMFLPSHLILQSYILHHFTHGCKWPSLFQIVFQKLRWTGIVCTHSVESISRALFSRRLWSSLYGTNRRNLWNAHSDPPPSAKQRHVSQDAPVYKHTLMNHNAHYPVSQRYINHCRHTKMLHILWNVLFWKHLVLWLIS